MLKKHTYIDSADRVSLLYSPVTSVICFPRHVLDQPLVSRVPFTTFSESYLEVYAPRGFTAFVTSMAIVVVVVTS
jgi:hypothetical protein